MSREIRQNTGATLSMPGLTSRQGWSSTTFSRVNDNDSAVFYIPAGELIYPLLLLGFNDAMEYLDLSWNHIRRKGATEITKGLRVRTSFLAKTTLTRTWTEMNILHSLVVLWPFFQTNCTLKTLNLSYNGFSNDGAVALGEAIRANNTLIELNIRWM